MELSMNLLRDKNEIEQRPMVNFADGVTGPVVTQHGVRPRFFGAVGDSWLRHAWTPANRKFYPIYRGAGAISASGCLLNNEGVVWRRFQSNEKVESHESEIVDRIGSCAAAGCECVGAK